MAIEIVTFLIFHSYVKLPDCIQNAIIFDQIHMPGAGRRMLPMAYAMVIIPHSHVVISLPYICVCRYTVEGMVLIYLMFGYVQTTFLSHP